VIIDDIKKRIAIAMKAGDTVARDVLRLALGEIQTAEARKNAPASDEEATAAVRKLIKSNEETLGLAGEGERPEVPPEAGRLPAWQLRDVLRRELEVLRTLLPQELTVDDIVAALGSQVEAIKAAKGDGQATGIAMKHLKAAGATVSGANVGEAVKKLRS
jgi:uncharacterized protein YqeY